VGVGLMAKVGAAVIVMDTGRQWCGVVGVSHFAWRPAGSLGDVAYADSWSTTRGRRGNR